MHSGEGATGSAMNRNRTPKSEVCEVPQENSWDLELLVRILNVGSALTSVLKGARTRKNPNSRADQVRA